MRSRPTWERAVAESQQNLVLSRLSKSDRALLEPHPEPADLPLRKVLEKRGKPIKAVYFPDSLQRGLHAGGWTGPLHRADDLRKAIDKSVSLHRSMLRYAHAFLEQATRTAVANGRSKIEERLARWLLMADDRLDGPELPLTHEFLAMMLGVRRPGVTIAVQELEREGMIVRRRGRIVITDRQALENMSNGTYVSAD